MPRAVTSLPWIALIALVPASAVFAEPPTVVQATPDNGDSDVDPGLTEIRIVFDQPMNTTGYSVVGGGPAFPKLAGKAKWADAKTLVVPVQLEADHEYWLSINSDSFRNCRSAAGESATPYPISFKTAKVGAAPKPPLTIEQNWAAVAKLKEAIDQHYSYRDRLKLDWAKLLADATPGLEAAKTPVEFARATARFLAPAQDAHVSVGLDKMRLPTHHRSVTANINLRTLPRLVPQWKAHNNTVATGRFDDGVTYLLIAGWPGGRGGDLEPAFEAIKAADPSKGIVIDVRPNGGGDEILARQIAGCFVDGRKVYSKNDIRRSGKFEGPFDRAVEPTKDRPAYRGKVVVLMGPACMSSNESFLMMMKQVPGCKLVGDRSRGSSGNPKPHDLGNGVTVYLPVWRDLQPDGTPIEGQGIAPDVKVKATEKDLAAADPVLEAALKVVRNAGAAGS
jgi:hypothetical protein